MIALPRWRKNPVYSAHPALHPLGQLKLFKIVSDDFVSLHAGVAAQAWKRQKLERLCRTISRPAVSEKRLPKKQYHSKQERADYNGVFAPNSKYRVDVTPAKRGKGCPHLENKDQAPEQRHQAMSLKHSA
jgi:hypothetical protein